jgi:hypothetical protein
MSEILIKISRREMPKVFTADQSLWLIIREPASTIGMQGWGDRNRLSISEGEMIQVRKEQ